VVVIQEKFGSIQKDLSKSGKSFHWYESRVTGEFESPAEKKQTPEKSRRNLSPIFSITGLLKWAGGILLKTHQLCCGTLWSYRQLLFFFAS